MRSAFLRGAESRRRRTAFVALLAVLSLIATVLSPSSAVAVNPPAAASGVVVDGAIVSLVNAQTGRFLDGDADGVVDQSLRPKLDDRWELDEVRPGVFTLRNLDRGRLLDADGPGRGYDVNLSDNHEADTEWRIEARGDGTFELINVEFGLWLDADDKDKGFNVDLTAGGDELDARWYIGLLNPGPKDLDGATVLVASAATGRFLDGDLNTVDQSVFPRDDDVWVIERSGDGVTIRGVANDRLLHGDSFDVNLNGAGGLSTEWSLHQRTEGTYEIRNLGAGLWLDADFGGKNFNVDLTANVSDLDASWNILVLDSDLGCVTEDFDRIDQLLLCIDAGDTWDHLEAFQAIADANGGVRASGTPGYDASANYVADLLQAAGFVIERQVFDFTVFTPVSVALTIDGVALIEEEEFGVAGFSPSGAVFNGQVTGVDLDLGPGNMSTSGCEPGDFDGVDLSGPSDVALIQRGACDFTVKALNAQVAGAEAVVFFNQGDTEDRKDVVFAAVDPGVVGILAIPVHAVGYDTGLAMLDSDAVSVFSDVTNVTAATENVIADLPGVNPNNVVMAGAHLDSVPQGPGIQDNGSGASALLALALMLADNKSYVPQNTLRFAWWGAEEAGLIGSTEYIFNPEFGITEAEFGALAAYLNFDIIASPNYIYGVYDADQSSFVAPVPVPPGSEALEDLFEAYYSIEGVPYEDTDFSGRSDYQAFINVGIPAGGLFTGAEQIKTAQQVSIWGGVAGDQFDPCYHLACDTIENVSFEAMEENIDALSYAIFILAGSTQAVNGVAGVGVTGTTPDQVALDGPQGTVLVGGGGLSVHAHAHGHDHGVVR